MSGAAAANALTKKVSATKEILIGAGLAIAVCCSLLRLLCDGTEPHLPAHVALMGCKRGVGFAVFLGLRVFLAAMGCC